MRTPNAPDPIPADRAGGPPPKGKAFAAARRCLVRLLFNDRRPRAGWRVVLFFSLFILLTGLSQFPLVALLLATWAMTRWIDRRPLASVGLALEPAALKHFAQGALLGGGLVGLGIFLAGLAGGAALGPGNAQGNGFNLIVMFGVIHLSIAALEELMVRGYAFQALIEGLGTLPALFVTALGFALLHLDNPHLPPLGLLNLGLAGMLLGVLVLRTRALWAAIGCHFAWNFVQGPLLGLPISGIQPEGFAFRLSLSGPAWLTGGAFGVEGSLLTSVLLTVSVVGLWRGRWLRPGLRASRLWQHHLRSREAARSEPL